MTRNLTKMASLLNQIRNRNATADSISNFFNGTKETDRAGILTFKIQHPEHHTTSILCAVFASDNQEVIQETLKHLPEADFKEALSANIEGAYAPLDYLRWSKQQHILSWLFENCTPKKRNILVKLLPPVVKKMENGTVKEASQATLDKESSGFLSNVGEFIFESCSFIYSVINPLSPYSTLMIGASVAVIGGASIFIYKRMHPSHALDRGLGGHAVRGGGTGLSMFSDLSSQPSTPSTPTTPPPSPPPSPSASFQSSSTAAVTFTVAASISSSSSLLQEQQKKQARQEQERLEQERLEQERQKKHQQQKEKQKLKEKIIKEDILNPIQNSHSHVSSDDSLTTSTSSSSSSASSLSSSSLSASSGPVTSTQSSVSPSSSFSFSSSTASVDSSSSLSLSSSTSLGSSSNFLAQMMASFLSSQLHSNQLAISPYTSHDASHNVVSSIVVQFIHFSISSGSNSILWDSLHASLNSADMTALNAVDLPVLTTNTGRLLDALGITSNFPAQIMASLLSPQLHSNQLAISPYTSHDAPVVISIVVQSIHFLISLGSNSILWDSFHASVSSTVYNAGRIYRHVNYATQAVLNAPSLPSPQMSYIGSLSNTVPSPSLNSLPAFSNPMPLCPQSSSQFNTAAGYTLDVPFDIHSFFSVSSSLSLNNALLLTSMPTSFTIHTALSTSTSSSLSLLSSLDSSSAFSSGTAITFAATDSSSSSASSSPPLMPPVIDEAVGNAPLSDQLLTASMIIEAVNSCIAILDAQNPVSNQSIAAVPDDATESSSSIAPSTSTDGSNGFAGNLASTDT